MEGLDSAKARSLAAAIGASVEGEVRFDQASRGAYSTDASNYRRVPMGVVVPRSTADVEATIAECRKHGVPIVSRGGGTSLDGQCCTHGVVMDFSKYLNRIVEIDPEAKTARVQPGVVFDTLAHKTVGAHGLRYAPDPSTHSHCTFGGMLGNNSCGVHSIMAGRSSDNVVSMDVLTGDGVRLRVGETGDEALHREIGKGGRVGEIYSGLARLAREYGDEIRSRYPNIPRRVSGYNLPDLLPENGRNIARALVGSEGTCVTILEATVRLIEWPKSRVMVILGYDSVEDAADAVPEIMETGPIGLEGFDHRLTDFIKLHHTHAKDINLLPKGSGWLIVEFGGDSRALAERAAQRLMDKLKKHEHPPAMELLDDQEREDRIWEVRESGLGATAFVPGMADTWPGWEDAGLPPDRVGEYLRKFRKLLNRYEYDCALYGHFGQGCVHCRINFDLTTRAGVEKYRAFAHDAAELVVSCGGSLSAEHGDGLSKSELLPIMYGKRIVQAFGEFKKLWDPDNLMNPGKIVAQPPVTADLRLGPAFAPKRLETVLTFKDAGRNFERAALRCVGVGKCRRRKDAFMCPSYIATQEEIHTTRGRARLLFEMVEGTFIADGWKSHAVRESLDLCLACKGCKKECPVNVDMASYKSEFLYHYYRGKLRPRSFYAMGHIGALADVASVWPWMANLVGRSKLTAPAAKRLAGVSSRRELPRFAGRTFTAWFRGRRAERARPDSARSGPVVLLPDVFNDHFYPGTLRAACEVLEALGYEVLVPEWRYPAIRPLVHYGFLPRARKLLDGVMDRLDPHAQRGVPIVGVEPSEVAVLRDESHGFFPKTVRTHRLGESCKLLSELLSERHGDELEARAKDDRGRCVFHAHCHQKAVLDAEGARKTLRHLGYEIEEPEPGCCGMAGSFGFEAEHAELAEKIGEENLLPAVRNAPAGREVVIEGFSCREQIKQNTGREPRHLAEVVRGALGGAGERDRAGTEAGG